MGDPGSWRLWRTIGGTGSTPGSFQVGGGRPAERPEDRRLEVQPRGAACGFAQCEANRLQRVDKTHLSHLLQFSVLVQTVGSA